MKITIDTSEVKEALVNFISKKYFKENMVTTDDVKSVTLHRKSSKTEDVGSVTIELE